MASEIHPSGMGLTPARPRGMIADAMNRHTSNNRYFLEILRLVVGTGDGRAALTSG